LRDQKNEAGRRDEKNEAGKQLQAFSALLPRVVESTKKDFYFIFLNCYRVTARVCVCSWASERVKEKHGAWHCSEGCGKQTGSAGTRRCAMAGARDPAWEEQRAYTVDPCHIAFCPFQG